MATTNCIDKTGVKGERRDRIAEFKEAAGDYVDAHPLRGVAMTVAGFAVFLALAVIAAGAFIAIVAAAEPLNRAVMQLLTGESVPGFWWILF